MQKITLIIITSFFFQNVFAQKELVQKADTFFKYEDNYQALEYYQKALKKASGNDLLAHIYFQMGLIHKKENRYQQALNEFSQSFQVGNKSPDVHYNIAEMQLRLGQYPEAKEQYLKYKSGGGSNYNIKNRLLSCEFALNEINKKQIIEIRNEKNINTEYMDYGVAQLGTGIIFSSNRPTENKTLDSYIGQGYTDFYEAGINADESYSIPYKTKGEINTDFNEGSFVYDSKNKIGYYMQCNGDNGKKNGCTIMQSVFNDNADTWLTPEQVKINVNGFSIGHPALSSNGKSIVFVSNMPTGFGGKDIWLSTKQSDGTWSNPKNLGKEINTQGNEMFPYISGDSILYFSSDELPGMGGLDIFKCKIDIKNGKVTDAENLGYPINSCADDFSMLILKENKGLFSSNRQGGVGDDDIYSFEYTTPPLILTVNGVVTDKMSKTPLQNALIILKGSDGSKELLKTEKDGAYKFTNLKPNVKYVLSLSKDEYFGESRNLIVSNETESKVFNKSNGVDYDFSLQKITKEEIEIQNIYYDFNSAELRTESKKELNKLVNMLNETPGVSIVINAHTDSKGSDKYNFNLSTRRAQSVVDYLIYTGISKERLASKGYGETQLVKKDAITEEEHQLNRRTTFRVTKIINE